MRYKAIPYSFATTDSQDFSRFVYIKKDGTLDMRFKESRKHSFLIGSLSLYPKKNKKYSKIASLPTSYGWVQMEGENQELKP